MKSDNKFEEEQRECSMLKDYVVSRMSDAVKDKIRLEGYTPLQVATIYILDLNKSLAYYEERMSADQFILTCENFQLLLIFNNDGTEIIDIAF